MASVNKKMILFLLCTSTMFLESSVDEVAQTLDQEAILSTDHTAKRAPNRAYENLVVYSRLIARYVHVQGDLRVSGRILRDDGSVMEGSGGGSNSTGATPTADFLHIYSTTTQTATLATITLSFGSTGQSSNITLTGGDTINVTNAGTFLVSYHASGEGPNAVVSASLNGVTVPGSSAGISTNGAESFTYGISNSFIVVMSPNAPSNNLRFHLGSNGSLVPSGGRSVSVTIVRIA